MKAFFFILNIIFILFYTKYNYSAEFIIQSNSRVKYNEFIFTDKSKYLTLHQLGQWTDSLGNYGSQECKGLVKKDNIDKVHFLDVVCKSVDKNNISTWRKYERKRDSQIQRGVGVSTIIDTNSKYKKDLIGTKCNYAVNRTLDMVFSKSVCKISDELYKKLLN